MRLLFIVSILLLSQSSAFCETVIIYRYFDGGSGYFIRHPIVIDGKLVSKLKPGEKVTLDLSLGKHSFKYGKIAQRWTFEVTGKHVLRIHSAYGDLYWMEALIDKDVELADEFAQMKEAPLLSDTEAMAQH